MTTSINGRSKPIDILPRKQSASSPFITPPDCQKSSPQSSNSPQLASSLQSMSNVEKPFAMKESEIALLRKTFNAMVPNAGEVGLKGVKKMFEQVPEALDIFSKRNIRKGDPWELMGHGLTLMNAIERIISRLDRPTALAEYIRQLKEGHKAKYFVTSHDMHSGLGAFQEPILQHLALLHDHSVEQNHCDICRCWKKFFDLLRDQLMLPPAVQSNDRRLSGQPSVTTA